LDRMRMWMPPVKPRADSTLQKEVVHTVPSGKPLFLRSLNRAVICQQVIGEPGKLQWLGMPGQASGNKWKVDSLAGGAGSFQRARSTSSLSRPNTTPGGLDIKPGSSQSYRQRFPNCSFKDVGVGEKTPIAGTLHCYFHQRDSNQGWSVNSGDKALRPHATRPQSHAVLNSTTSLSAFLATSPKAMFSQPRTLYQGLSEPVWR